jgi:hypothetical protein
MDRNWVQDSTVSLSATSEDASFPVSNLALEQRALKWRSTGVDDEGVVIDIKTEDAIDSVVVMTDGINDIRLSPSATVSLQGNATDEWTSPALDQALTYDETNELYSHYFTTDQSYRYWRIYVDDPGNPFGFIELSKIVLAKSTILTQGPNKGFTYGLEDQSSQSSTDFGHVYTDQFPVKKSLEFEYELITLSDMETLADLYLRVGSKKAVAVALDTQEEAFDKDRFFVYGKLQGSVDVKHSTFTFFNMPWGIEEIF